MPFNKGDFTQQGVAGHVNANLRLNEKRLVNIDLTSNEEAEGCTIAGTVKDLLNDKVYPIGSGASGKITITENGTDIDVARYRLADVNVSGGSGEMYHVSGTLTSEILAPTEFVIPHLTTGDFEGQNFSLISLTTGNIDNESDPVTFESLIPVNNLMGLNLLFSLVGSSEIVASNEVNCTVNVNGSDISITITDDNASFDLTVTAGTQEGN